jgi:hypothetical protein
MTPGSPPRLRRIATPSVTWREMSTDCATLQPDRAPARYGLVPSPSESPIANTARSRTTSFARSTTRPLAKNASWYAPEPSMSNRVREGWPSPWVRRSRQRLRSPRARKQTLYRTLAGDYGLYSLDVDEPAGAAAGSMRPGLRTPESSPSVIRNSAATST